VQVDRLAQTATLDKLPAGNILTVLSTRTEDLPRESLLARMADFDEILWQTPAPERAVADLHVHGFEAVDVLVDGALGRKIIYAAKRNTKGTMQ
jgi:hypothetical protein